MEEFEAIMGITKPHRILMLLDSEFHLLTKIHSTLRIPKSKLCFWLSNSALDFHSFVDYFRGPCSADCFQSTQALAMSFQGVLFLVHSLTRLDPILIDIMVQMMGENIVPMILAETLNGLDDMKREKADYLKGSPSLLYVQLTSFYFSSNFCLSCLLRVFNFFLFLFCLLYFLPRPPFTGFQPSKLLNFFSSLFFFLDMTFRALAHSVPPQVAAPPKCGFLPYRPEHYHSRCIALITRFQWYKFRNIHWTCPWWKIKDVGERNVKQTRDK